MVSFISNKFAAVRRSDSAGRFLRAGRKARPWEFGAWMEPERNMKWMETEELNNEETFMDDSNSGSAGGGTFGGGLLEETGGGDGAVRH